MLQGINIYKKFKQPVLNGINFSAGKGEVVGIAGENGSGKSTLLSLLTGILKPDKGQILLDGKNISKESIKQSIGYVPQATSLLTELSSHDNIKFWAAAHGVKNPTLDFDKEFLDKKVKHLSGGMKKRLSIAISLLHDPDFLIMDEPTAALDINFKELLLKQISERKTHGKSVIFTSHQPDELQACDTLYILKDGRFVFTGPPSDINFSGGGLSAIFSSSTIYE